MRTIAVAAILFASGPFALVGAFGDCAQQGKTIFETGGNQ
jgi:hypothetical protein